MLLHVLFWGAGAAILAMPRPWRRFWPVLVAPMGFALQSAVVWAGAYAGLPGTNSYACISEVVPLVLLVLGLRRLSFRAAATDVARFGLVWLAVAGSLAALILPLAFASKGLNTVSLGSCDAADYAAGARTLMEFARSDRDGFIGLTEVVRVHSADSFFEYWLRLNHFTPAALIAFNGSVLDCAPYELASLMAMVLLVGSLPLVFWMARAVVGYSGGVSLIVALLYGCSPITWYAIAHVALGQLLAAQAIALLTWAGVALWRGRLTWRRGLQFAGVLGAGYWIVLGSYNFILVLCLVPAVAYAAGLMVWHGEWRKFGQWGVVMLAPLVASVALFFGRISGLAERFTLLRAYDFGWPVPILSPEGWLGMVSGPSLEAWPFGLRWLLSALVGGLFVWAMLRAMRLRRPGAWVVLAIAAPVMAGYGYLELRGIRLGTNASYDAYKLLAVFYPLLLPAFCWWLTLRRSRRLVEWFGVVGVLGLVVFLNVVAAGVFVWRLATPPLMVDRELRQVAKIEAMSDVKSVNLLLPDMWSRLWANSFLLRKPQYFPTHTYEGRLNTPLRGEWNLESGLIAWQLPNGASKRLSPHYTLVRASVAGALSASFGKGWHPEERPRDGGWCRWSAGDATLRIENPRDRPITVVCVLEARSVAPRQIELGAGGASAGAGRADIGVERGRHSFPPVTLPPGRTELTVRLFTPPTAVAGDPRPLGLCVYGITLELRE